ncbi:glycine oxidase ThiO [Oceanobacillus oncorhynchi subsp. incaldanensis]|uniref:glycine oxidase n=2 Tax=Oceanobacillus TaxID=182709 RepID=A0A0A1MS80_9BACI|nr:glycine oxidase ThiO [Oceanobacillus oncorhynchi]MDM8099864.1 glycine oxidase ThiO [Oceanobacillus oncorhynchi]UUI40402.1 glycine oxidase ThiO [Oceanobacillus oncorhynchi]GIO18667.1 glycine oxidase ThiO [Oceanobacillus oncorhynchi subsp. incaldanensis]CEI81826.1 Glycine oxidase [Oceanobacillus oncorhynchi]
MNKQFDQIIVGGGVIGCSIAYQLAKRGNRVLVIERNQIGCEASSAAAGMLGAQGEFTEDSPLFRFAHESRALFKNLSEELKEASGVDIQYIHKGIMKLAFHQQQYSKLQSVASFQREAGNPAYLLSVEEAKKMEPSLTENLRAVLYLPDDGQVSARHLTKAFSLAASHYGAVLHEQESVNELLIENETVYGVRTTEAIYEAVQVIVATGAFGDELLPADYAAIPVKGECLLLELDQKLFQSTLWMDGCYLVPKQGKKVIVGASSIPGKMDKHVHAASVQRLLSRAQKMVPELAEARIRKMWAGIRPSTADELPYLGEIPGIPGLYAAKGHYRNGILLSPITGIYMADLIENKPVSPLYYDCFHADRQNKKLEKAGEST